MRLILCSTFIITALHNILPASSTTLSTDAQTSDSCYQTPDYKYPLEDEYGKICLVDDGSDAELFFQNQKSLKDEVSRDNAYFFQRFFKLSDHTTASLIIGDGNNNHGSDRIHHFTKFINAKPESTTTFTTGLSTADFFDSRFFANRYFLNQEKFYRDDSLDSIFLIDLESGKKLLDGLLSQWTAVENDQLIWAKADYSRKFIFPPFTRIAVNNFEIFPYFHELTKYGERPDNVNDLDDKQFFLLDSAIESPTNDILEFTGYLFNRYYDFNNVNEDKRLEEDKKYLSRTHVRIEGISKLGKLYDTKKDLSPNTIKVTTTLLPNENAPSEKYKRQDSVGMIWKPEDSTDRDLFYQEQLTLKTPEQRLHALRHHRFFRIDDDTTVSVIHTPGTSDIVTLKYHKNKNPGKVEFLLPGFKDFQSYYEDGSYNSDAIYKAFDNRFIWFNDSAWWSSQNGFLIDLKSQKKVLNYSANNFAVYNDQLIHFTTGNPKPHKNQAPWVNLKINNYSIFPRLQELDSNGNPLHACRYHQWVPNFILYSKVYYRDHDKIEFYGWVVNRDYDFSKQADRDALEQFTENNKRKHVTITGINKLSALHKPVSSLTYKDLNVTIEDMDDDRSNGVTWEYYSIDGITNGGW